MDLYETDGIRSRVALRGWKLVAFCAIIQMISGCSDAPFVVLEENLDHDPSGVAPLAASLELKTVVPTDVNIVVRSLPDSRQPDLTFNVGAFSTDHEVSILGLYAAATNVIEVSLHDEAGNTVGSWDFELETPSIPDGLPQIDILHRDPTALYSSSIGHSMTFVNYFGYAENATPQTPFVFDQDGHIRWYLDFRDHPELGDLFYANGMKRLQNGNLIFGDSNSNMIYEIDLHGCILNRFALPGFELHHDVIEKSDGNLLATVNKEDAITVEDHIIELDRLTGDVINVWDLRESLDPNRLVMRDDPNDWIHVNAVVHDERDDTIIVSGRTQGTIKLDYENNVVWILSPHMGWGSNANGVDLAANLLIPLSANGVEISDQTVLDGNASHPEFEWSWFQHAPEILPDGKLLQFDNGGNRNFIEASGLYSRAVVYSIDEDDLTIRQDWSWGSSRGQGLFSPVVSDVDYHADTDSIVMSSGSINFAGVIQGRIVEIDFATKEVIQDVAITPPTAYFNLVTFHRSQRILLYEQ